MAVTEMCGFERSGRVVELYTFLEIILNILLNHPRDGGPKNNTLCVCVECRYPDLEKLVFLRGWTGCGSKGLSGQE